VGRVVVAVIVVVLGLGGVAVAQGGVPCEAFDSQPSCDVVLRPGPSDDAVGFISIADAVDPDPTGELRLTTVAVEDDLTWRSWFAARGSTSSEAVPREQIYPPGVDREQVAETNAALMVDSQQVATIIALEELGFELRGRGAVIAAVTEDAVTEELEPGDVIVAVDGEPMEESADVVAAVQANEPGATISFEVVNDDDTRDVEVTLGASPDDPERAFVGVLLTTDLDLPLDVSIDAGAIGGPSAGLLFALAIVDLLDEGELTGGEVIAGTGTLNRAGEVGAVGGVRQKVAGASSSAGDQEPATVFLVPRGNFDEARAVEVTNDVLVVPVDTFDDALAALEAVRDGREPADAVLLAAAAR